MKKLAIVCLLFSFVTMIYAQEKKNESSKENEIEKVQKLISSKTWEFEADQMIPSRGKSRMLTSTQYGVVLKNDTVDSNLPYVGRASSAEYGSSDSPMTLNEPISDYSIKDGKKGSHIIKFSARKKSNNIYFIFTVTSDGSVTLSINSTNNDSITYYGILKPLETK